MIPIGATVDIANHGGRWRGVVTGHPGPYSIEIDGRLTAPANLAKVVGEMTDEKLTGPQMQAFADLEQSLFYTEQELTAAVAERDALRELVVAQATTNAELAQQLKGMGDPEEWKRLQIIQDDFGTLRASVRQHLFNLFGTYTPSSMDCRSKGIDASDLIEEMARYEG